jgi:hypothetical protein
VEGTGEVKGLLAGVGYFHGGRHLAVAQSDGLRHRETGTQPYAIETHLDVGVGLGVGIGCMRFR